MKKKTSTKPSKTESKAAPSAKVKASASLNNKAPAKKTSKPASKSKTTKSAKEKSSTKKPVVKSVVAEVMEESADPSSLQHDKVYAIPAEDELHHEEISDSDDAAVDIPAKSLVPSVGRPGVTSTDPLAIYLADIRKYPLLTKEKELEIAKKYFETKDPEAAQTLIKSNLRFVVKVAADYSRFGAKMIDLIQEGNVGLMHAVREYNPYKGARLITYAVWWIRGYIQEYLMRQYSMVRIGTTQNQRKLFYQLQREKEALDAMGQEPNLKLLSSRLGIPEDEIEQMSQRMSGRDISLDRPLDNDSSSSLLDLQRSTADMSLDDRIAHEEQLEILKKKLEALRPELSEREKIILDERILNDEPLTLQEIGEKHGITREAVRQMEARVLKKIKNKMDSDV